MKRFILFLLIAAAAVGAPNGVTLRSAAMLARSAGGPFMLDTFTGTSGTAITSHAGEIGATWVKVSGSGTAIISPSGKYRPNSSGGTFWAASGVSSGGDCSVATRVYLNSNTSYVGPCIRVNSATNTGYVSFLAAPSNDWQLWSFVNGSGSQLATALRASLNGNCYIVKLVARGTKIELVVDGVAVISVTNSAISGAGKVGIWSDGAISDSTGISLGTFTAVNGAVTPTREVVFDGNSFTAGHLTTDASAYPTQCIMLLPETYRSVGNYGVSGQTTVQMSLDAAIQIDPLINAGTYPAGAICVPWEIRNDIVVGGQNATQAYANYVAYCQARRAAGWRVVAVTVLPCSGGDEPGDFETSRQTINASIRSNWNTFADTLADVAADSRIGDAGDQNDLTYYNADKLHPSNAGSGVVALIVAAAIAGIP